MDIIEQKTGIMNDNFWHKSKRQLVDSLFKKLPQKHYDILVIGCGTGEDLSIIKQYSRKLVVTDSNVEAIANISEDVERRVLNATSLDFSKASFDVVVSLDVFEHIENDSLAIAECRRVLRDNGYLILTVPAWSWLFSSYDKALLHYRR